jgi:hypothetical protein
MTLLGVRERWIEKSKVDDDDNALQFTFIVHDKVNHILVVAGLHYYSSNTMV